VPGGRESIKGPPSTGGSGGGMGFGAGGALSCWSKRGQAGGTGGSPSPTSFSFDLWRSRLKRLIMDWFFATSGSEPAMTRASMAVSLKFAEAFSLTLTAFLSSRRQSSKCGRFSCFIGGAIVNVPVSGRQEGLPLDANSSGGSVWRSLGKIHPKNQTIGSPYLLTRSPSSFQQRPFYICRRDL
jgi:hypothetical protein